MRDDEGLLDIAEAAQFLNVSEVSLRRWTNAGRLACVRVGRRRERRFRRADLIAFLEHQPARRSPESGASPLREPGPSGTALTALPLGTHLCGLYASEHGRAAQAAAFLAQGLQGGSVSYLVAAPDAQREVLAQLAGGEPTLQAHIDAGRLVLSEYAATARAQTAYWERTFRAAMARGATSLCVVGDVSGAQLAAGQPFTAVVDYEERYDRLLAQRFPVVTLCQYDVRRCAGVDLLDVLKCHEDALRDPGERVLA
jgi:transcriptional repressor of dcmA and dcmR